MSSRAARSVMSLIFLAMPLAAQTPTYVRVTAPTAEIRSGPGNDFPSLGTVKKGTVFELLKAAGAWYQVRLPSNLGFKAPLGYLGTVAGEVAEPRREAPRVARRRTPGRSPQSGRRSSSPETGFEQGANLIGPRVGFPSQGGGLAVGANFEHAMSPVIGFGAFADYWGYNTGGIKYTYTAVGGTGSYHYKTLDKRLDPFVGVALGYYIVSVDLPDLCNATNCRLSRGFIGGFGGVRYFFTPQVAATLRAGLGASYLTAGIDWKF